MNDTKVIISMNKYNMLNQANKVLEHIHCLVKDNVRIDFLNNPDLPVDVQIAFVELMKENYPDIETRIEELRVKKEEKENKDD